MTCARSLPVRRVFVRWCRAPGVLTKEHLRVSRAGGGYRPQFVGADGRAVAARVLDIYGDHVGEPRSSLAAALERAERDADDYKLVRGLAHLAERDAAFETRSPVPPARARRVAFDAAASVGVVTDSERETALSRAAADLGTTSEDVEASLFADRPDRRILVAFDSRWDADALCTQYDLSLAQTALFDAHEVRVRSSDPRRLVSAAKRLGLLYEIEQTDDGRELVLTGPDALFRRTRRYGTAFARLLRSVVGAEEWALEATVDDRETERTLRLTETDLSLPGTEPVADAAESYDSAVEADFAARFGALDLDWALTREPEPLDAGDRVMIPDFAFDFRPPGVDESRRRVFFEIMGFWTPDYVEKKLAQVDAVEGVDLVVAVDESLGVGEDLETRGSTVLSYTDRVRVKDVVDALGGFEDDLVDAAAADLPDELRPDADVTTLAHVAADSGVPVDAVEHRTFPDHDRVGRTLVRPAVLDELGGKIEVGMPYETAEEHVEAGGIDDVGAVLAALGYRVEWEGLGGGTVAERGDD